MAKIIVDVNRVRWLINGIFLVGMAGLAFAALLTTAVMIMEDHVELLIAVL